MSQEDIDATKAPLMDHLIELRARLIRSLYAFFAAFLVCFYFSRTIYNILTQPYVRVVGADKATLIATHFLEQFYTNIRLSMFGAAVIAFPVIAVQVYKFVAPGLYKNERQAFPPYLIATPMFFLAGALLVYFVVMPLLIRFSVSLQQVNQPGEATIELAAQGQRISVADHDADLRLRHRLPASGRADAARPGRHHQFGISVTMRRYAIVAVVGIAAILTPPDLISMCSLALPMLLLYEGGGDRSPLGGEAPRRRSGARRRGDVRFSRSRTKGAEIRRRRAEIGEPSPQSSALRSITPCREAAILAIGRRSRGNIRCPPASWRSGYAEDCKSLHPGSIPGEASNFTLGPGRRRPIAGQKPWR